MIFGMEVQELEEQVNSMYIKTLCFDIIIPCIWLIGVLGYLILLILGNIKLNKKIENNFCTDERIIKILNNCKNTLKINKNVKIILQKFKKTPSIVGIIHPKILITEEFLKNNNETIKYILMHELSHYKRKDTILNYVLLLATALHWFNPFVWVFFKKIRQDIELATDALVINYLETGEEKNYGRTLIKSLENFQEEKYTARLLCVTDDTRNMERRIKMIKLKNKFNKNKLLIAIVSIVIIASVIIMFFIENKNDNLGVANTEIEDNNEISKCKYKSFKPSFKLTEDSTYDNYDFTQDMEYEESIYHKKIDSYEEYIKIKSRWNDILEMNEEDFKNSFMVITAIENTSMVGLNVDKIETDNNTLYISLKLEGNLIDENTNYTAAQYENTCISYIIPRTMERENIKCVRNYRDDEKDFSTEMNLAERTDKSTGKVFSFQYKDAEYRKAIEKESITNSSLHIIQPEWKDMIYEKFTVKKDMPDINFDNWQNLGNDFYCLSVTDYSEYAKLMNNYNVKKLFWHDFKYIYAMVIIRANADNTIGIDNITTDENENSYLPVFADGMLDVTEEFKYPGMVVILPNYRSLEESHFEVKLK